MAGAAVCGDTCAVIAHTRIANVLELFCGVIFGKARFGDASDT